MPDFTVNVDLPPTDFTAYNFGSVQYGDYWFSTGTNQYIFLYRPFDTKVHTLKSTDGGTNWVDMGSVTIPITSGDGGPHFTVGIDGDTAFLFYVRLHNASVAPAITWAIDGLTLHKFNMSADTWSTGTDYNTSVVPLDFSFSHAAINTLSPLIFMSLMVRASGDYVLMFSSTQAIDSGSFLSARVSYVPFDGTLFGAAIQLAGQSSAANYYLGVGAAFDGTLTHFIAQTNSTIHFGQSLVHWTANSTGTMTGPHIITSDLYLASTPGQVSDPWIMGSNVTCAAYINNDAGSATQSIRVFYAPISNTTSWSNTVVTNDQSHLPLNLYNIQQTNRIVALGAGSGLIACYANAEDDFWTKFALGSDSSSLICLWTVHPDVPFPYGYVYYSKSTDSGVTWNTPALLFPDLTSHISSPFGMQVVQIAASFRPASSEPLSFTDSLNLTDNVGVNTPRTFNFSDTLILADGPPVTHLATISGGGSGGAGGSTPPPGSGMGNCIFEFYEMQTPEDVEVLPTPKKYDQLGPMRFDKIGKIFGFRVRLIMNGTTTVMPYKVYGDDSESDPTLNSIYYQGSFQVRPGIDNVYEIQFPKNVNTDICRLTFGPTADSFHRYDVLMKVHASGMKGQAKWMPIR